jgi:hypothetical protein
MARTNTRGKGKKSGDITDYRHESATRKRSKGGVLVWIAGTGQDASIHRC